MSLPRDGRPVSPIATPGAPRHDVRYYRNIDTAMKNYAEIAAVWEEIGITPDLRQRLGSFS